jgi:hypothetical protein
LFDRQIVQTKFSMRQRAFFTRQLVSSNRMLEMNRSRRPSISYRVGH